jgi:Na+/proline symporter
MGLNVFDVAVIVLYLACVTAFGMHFRKKQDTIKGYFLAGNTIPWWAISASPEWPTSRIFASCNW